MAGRPQVKITFAKAEEMSLKQDIKKLEKDKEALEKDARNLLGTKGKKILTDAANIRELEQQLSDLKVDYDAKLKELELIQVEIKNEAKTLSDAKKAVTVAQDSLRSLGGQISTLNDELAGARSKNDTVMAGREQEATEKETSASKNVDALKTKISTLEEIYKKSDAVHSGLLGKIEKAKTIISIMHSDEKIVKKSISDSLLRLNNIENGIKKAGETLKNFNALTEKYEELVEKIKKTQKELKGIEETRETKLQEFVEKDKLLQAKVDKIKEDKEWIQHAHDTIEIEKGKLRKAQYRLQRYYDKSNIRVKINLDI